MKGLIFDIKEFAVFDGPGIRTTVFLKGCPLRCRWCHNPEGLLPKAEIMVSKAACIHCGECGKACDHPDRCTACGKCIPACRLGLRKICGQEWTPDALAARLLKDRDVYQDSGGGVTFSGGEPLLQWEFIAETIEKMPGIHAAIETSGYATGDVFRKAMEGCSLIMMDWKVSDPEAHRFYTGVSQDAIRRNLEMLCNGTTPFIIRMPVIPDVNDSEEHFRTLADLVKNAEKLVRVDILPYQRAAGAKYAMVGRKYCPGFDEAKIPHIFTGVFEEYRIPFQQFR